VLMALSAASRTKRSCSGAKMMQGSSQAKSIKVLAQKEFRADCSQFPDAAASSTKIMITTTNIIRLGDTCRLDPSRFL